jgi:tripartite-type tricarboxylate transporter receptor subunit TctC
MKIARRRVLRLVASAAALPALSRMARAQAYPTRPITMIVPLAAGNTFDALARILAERMGLSLRQPIIIRRRSGRKHRRRPGSPCQTRWLHD